MNTNQYLDSRNMDLWNVLNNHFNITFARSESNYGLYTIRKNAIIYLPNEKPCIDSFTHELLHLLLDKKEIYVTGGLKLNFANQIFDGIFKDDLANHVGNCLDHVKMLPLYLKMGFDREKFIADYHQPKFTNQEASLIEMSLSSPGILWKTMVNLSVAKYFAAKACPNIAFDYTFQLTKLKTADPTLFEILETLWINWEKLDIDNIDPILNNYHILTYDFHVDLQSWILEKKQSGFL